MRRADGAGDDVLAGLPELSVRGLGDSDARALLLANVPGPLDAAVCDQIVMESHGNPLALLELPRTWNVAGLAGGFGLPRGQPVAGRIEQSYIRRLQLLPPDTQLLVLTAAAEPLGDPVLLHRAAAMRSGRAVPLREMVRRRASRWPALIIGSPPGCSPLPVRRPGRS